MLQAPLLSMLPGIRHGFFTRAGGVSDGLYDSLNGTGRDAMGELFKAIAFADPTLATLPGFDS